MIEKIYLSPSDFSYFFYVCSLFNLHGFEHAHMENQYRPHITIQHGKTIIPELDRCRPPRI